MFILMLHDLEDIFLYGTEDKAVFEEAECSSDLQEWIYKPENYTKLTELEDLTGILILGFAHSLAC